MGSFPLRCQPPGHLIILATNDDCMRLSGAWVIQASPSRAVFRLGLAIQARPRFVREVLRGSSDWIIHLAVLFIALRILRGAVTVIMGDPRQMWENLQKNLQRGAQAGARLVTLQNNQLMDSRWLINHR